MADKKISELNTASAVYDADDFALVQDGETKQVNASTVKAYAKDGLSKSDVGLGNVDNTSDATKNSAVATLTNKTISGSSNTLSNIANASLTNSSITINGNAVSLGGSTTVSASTTNTLTIGTGLSGTSFNGSAATTIDIDSTVVTLTGTQTLTNKTLTSPSISDGTVNNTAIGGTTPAAGNFTTLGATGNVTLGDASGDTATINAGTTTFAGTGQRITGDFSNATIANRLMFQTSTVNGGTSVGLIPNGTSAATELRLYNNTDPTNSARAMLGANVADVRLVSGIDGAGAYLPMIFLTGGSERARIDTSGNVGIGTGSPGQKVDIVKSQTAGDITTMRQIRIGVDTSSTYSGYFGYGSPTVGQQAGIVLQALDNGTAAPIYTIGSSLVLRQSSNAANTSVSFNTTVQNALTLDSSGVLSLGQGKLKFPATQVPSSDVNTLDDYEEGTWSPTLTGFTFVGSSTSQYNYVKVGKVVTVSIFIGAATSVAWSAAATITLPFAQGPVSAGVATTAYSSAVIPFSVYNDLIRFSAAGSAVLNYTISFSYIASA